MGLQHGPHADGPHGGQKASDRGKSSQSDTVSFGHYSRRSAEGRIALRAEERLQWRAHADGSMSPGSGETFRRRTCRAGSIDQNETKKDRQKITRSVNPQPMERGSVSRSTMPASDAWDLSQVRFQAELL